MNEIELKLPNQRGDDVEWMVRLYDIYSLVVIVCPLKHSVTKFIISNVCWINCCRNMEKMYIPDNLK